MRRVCHYVSIRCAKMLTYILQFVKVYKIPLTGPSQFIQVPVSRGDSLDDHDVPELEHAWSFEGYHRKFTRMEHIISHLPLSAKPCPFKRMHGGSKTGAKTQKRFRKYHFKVYVREALEYEMPFNEMMKRMHAGTCVRAEFIIVEHTTSGQRATNCKHIDHTFMNRLALECVQVSF